MAAYKYTDVLLDSLQGFIVSVTFCYRNGEVRLYVLNSAFFVKNMYENYFLIKPGISCQFCPLKIKDSNSDFLSSFSFDFFKTFVFDVDNDKAPPSHPICLLLLHASFPKRRPTPTY